jgi:hypothetical protein
MEGKIFVKQKPFSYYTFQKQLQSGDLPKGGNPSVGDHHSWGSPHKF